MYQTQNNKPIAKKRGKRPSKAIAKINIANHEVFAEKCQLVPYSLDNTVRIDRKPQKMHTKKQKIGGIYPDVNKEKRPQEASETRQNRFGRPTALHCRGNHPDAGSLRTSFGTNEKNH